MTWSGLFSSIPSFIKIMLRIHYAWNKIPSPGYHSWEQRATQNQRRTWPLPGLGSWWTLNMPFARFLVPLTLLKETLLLHFHVTLCLGWRVMFSWWWLHRHRWERMKCVRCLLMKLGHSNDCEMAGYSARCVWYWLSVSVIVRGQNQRSHWGYAALHTSVVLLSKVSVTWVQPCLRILNGKFQGWKIPKCESECHLTRVIWFGTPQPTPRGEPSLCPACPLVTSSHGGLAVSACVQVTIVLLNNGPKTQEKQCWQFGYAGEKP